MQIKVEIDVKPEELRRFLGLPDVAGLQEDVIQFLRDKLGSASENFDPAGFVRDNLHTLRNSSAWKRLVKAAKTRASGLYPDFGLAPEEEPAPEPAPAKKKARSRSATAKARPKRARTTAKKAKAAAEKSAEEPAVAQGDGEAG